MNKEIEIFEQKITIKNIDRANQKKQKPKIIWFTGISGSGKSTLANALDEKLTIDGKHSYILDGDSEDQAYVVTWILVIVQGMRTLGEQLKQQG